MGGRFAVLAAVLATVVLAFVPAAAPWALRPPAPWLVPFDAWIGAAATWLMRDAGVGPWLFKDLTRAVGTLLEAPVVLLQHVLVKGATVGGATVGPLSWVGVTALFAALGMAARDPRLAALAALTFAYTALLGLWDSAMMTLALVVVAVAYGVVAGVVLGVMVHRMRRLGAFVDPLLDFMQTVPVFGYLVPAILLFGYGPAAALLITLIYAVPPMARVTANALAQADPETVEVGRMAGCSRRQILLRVLLPSQRPRLMLGVNQVIMLTLNMVIIASMIGAAGLGYDVWQALKSLHIGKGAEAGIAITLLAIVLDRLSQRFAAQRPDHRRRDRPFAARHRWLIGGIAAALVATATGHAVPAIARWPAEWAVTSGRFWDGIVDWINIHGYGVISVVRDGLFLYVLRPLKDALLALPWAGVASIVGALGWRLGGARLAALGAGSVGFVALAGQWDKAMVSVYLVAVAALLAAIVGVPVGFAAAGRDRLRRLVDPVLDTLQTLPSFVYLIPVVMLFSVGDFSALVAVVLYALAPAIRYTIGAVRQVPGAAVEAARAVGATRAQRNRRVVLPLALPDIVLGLNQTLMLAISMLVITALVGTRDLGQETLIALSKSDPGRGLVAGVCVALMAITADRFLRAWVARRRALLGLPD